MAPESAKNFDVLFTEAGHGFKAMLIDSPAGQTTHEFKLLLSKTQIFEFLSKLRPPKRSAETVDEARRFGSKLFEALFSGEMLALYRASLDACSRSGSKLLIRLRTGEAPSLAELPWEFMYDKSLDRYIALSTNTPIVRFLNLPERMDFPPIVPPLKILVVISSPTDYPPLDIEKEWRILQKAASQGNFAVVRAEKATMAALQGYLQKDSYHALHYVGHGDFDQQQDVGSLVFESDRGSGVPVTGDSLAMLLHDHKSLRVVNLNACEGARTAQTQTFSGVGQNIIQQGIPAVIAMQFPISDDAAIQFASQFYSALGNGYSVDAALGEARKALSLIVNSIEWGTPVLYMRSQGGELFAKPSEEKSMNSESKPKPGGGIHINVGGNVSGKIEAAEGDIVHGDSYTIGNISGSGAVALGQGAQASNSSISDPFPVLYQQLQSLSIPDFKKEEVSELIKKLEEQKDVHAPEQDRVDYYLSKLEDLAPDIAETLVGLLINPAAAIGKGLQMAIRAWRESRRT